MSDRDLVIEAVRKMPVEASLADILDELALLASVKQGLDESDRREGISSDRVMGMIDEWITKSSGRRAA